MNRYSLTALLCVVTAVVLFGCNSTNTPYQEKLKQDKYLQRSYPEKQPQSKEKPAIKTNYYQEITAGKVVVGMNLLEAKAATKTHPYGPNRFNTVYWCNEQLVDACDATCNKCAGTLVTPTQLHFLEGKQDKLLVVKSIPRRMEDTVAKLKRKPLRVVNALFLNQLVPGMTIKDFQRVEQLPSSKTEFYCKSQRVFQSCLLDCGECTVKIITPRNNQFHIQTVRFRGHNDFATIVDITKTVASSTP